MDVSLGLKIRAEFYHVMMLLCVINPGVSFTARGPFY